LAIYIAKPNEWFKAGTEVKLVERYSETYGLFSGVRVCEHARAECRPLGIEYEDEEVCGFHEFEIKETP
jgi:hypothetical protein